MIWKKLQAIAIINTVSIIFVISEPPDHVRGDCHLCRGFVKFLAIQDISIQHHSLLFCYFSCMNYYCSMNDLEKNYKQLLL